MGDGMEESEEGMCSIWKEHLKKGEHFRVKWGHWKSDGSESRDWVKCTEPLPSTTTAEEPSL